MTKLRRLDEAMSEFVPDGSSVVMGAALEALVPFAAGYELIRQQRRELTLIAPISDMLFDVLIGAGVARRVIASWVGNVSAGSGYNFRRAIEQQIPAAVEMVDHSNLSLALALHAGAMGVPFLPTRSTLGTDLLANNPRLTEMQCPITGDELVAVLAVQRADAQGNAHVWGNLGVTFDAARASKSVVVLAEEIVSEELIRADPNRTIIPGFLVSAVIPLRHGCHPSPCQDYDERDHIFFQSYHDRSRSRDDFLDWLDRYVLSVSGHEEYLERVRSPVRP